MELTGYRPCHYCIIYSVYTCKRRISGWTNRQHKPILPALAFEFTIFLPPPPLGLGLGERGVANFKAWPSVVLAEEFRLESGQTQSWKLR